MKAVLDACVLFPTVLRQILIGAADLGAYQPIWSPRILEEWHRAAARLGGAEGEIAKGEIASLRQSWPGASVPGAEDADLWLPDPDDVHVLATAIAANAPLIVTRNLKDFPRRVTQAHGINAGHPDPFLLQIAREHPDAMADLVGNVHARWQGATGGGLDLRGLLKRAGLPRLGKALG